MSKHDFHGPRGILDPRITLDDIKRMRAQIERDTGATPTRLRVQSVEVLRRLLGSAWPDGWDGMTTLLGMRVEYDPEWPNFCVTLDHAPDPSSDDDGGQRSAA